MRGISYVYACCVTLRLFCKLIMRVPDSLLRIGFRNCTWIRSDLKILDASADLRDSFTANISCY
jgi:hypothetical protein